SVTVTRDSARVRPSALEMNLWATTRTSSRDGAPDGMAAAMSSAGSSPARISGRPSSATAVMASPIGRRSGSAARELPQHPPRVRGAAAGVLQGPLHRLEILGSVEVQGQRRDLDGVSRDPGRRRVAMVAIVAAGPEGGLHRVGWLKEESVGAGAVAVGHD